MRIVIVAVVMALVACSLVISCAGCSSSSVVTSSSDPVHFSRNDFRENQDWIVPAPNDLLLRDVRFYNLSRMTKREIAAAYKDELAQHLKLRNDFSAWLDELSERGKLPDISTQPWQFQIKQQAREKRRAPLEAEEPSSKLKGNQQQQEQQQPQPRKKSKKVTKKDPNMFALRDYTLHARSNISRGGAIMNIPYYALLSYDTLCADQPPDVEPSHPVLCDMFGRMLTTARIHPDFITEHRPTAYVAALDFHKIMLSMTLVLLRWGDAKKLGRHMASYQPFALMLPLEVDVPACSFTEEDLLQFPGARQLLRIRQRHLTDLIFLKERLLPEFDTPLRSKNKNKSKNNKNNNEGDILTAPRFLWARCIVESRAMASSGPPVHNDGDVRQPQTNSNQDHNGLIVSAALIPLLEKASLQRSTGRFSGGTMQVKLIEDGPLSATKAAAAAAASHSKKTKKSCKSNKNKNDEGKGDGEEDEDEDEDELELTPEKIRQFHSRYFQVSDPHRSYTAGQQVAHSPLDPRTDLAASFIHYGFANPTRSQVCLVLELPPPVQNSRERNDCLAIFVDALLHNTDQAPFVYNPLFFPQQDSANQNQNDRAAKQRQRQRPAVDPQEMCLRLSAIEVYSRPERVAQLLVDKMGWWNKNMAPCECRTRAALVRALDMLRGAVEKQKALLDASFLSVGRRLRLRRQADMNAAQQEAEGQQQQSGVQIVEDKTTTVTGAAKDRAAVDGEEQQQQEQQRRANVEMTDEEQQMMREDHDESRPSSVAREAEEKAARQRQEEDLRLSMAPHLYEIFDYIRTQRFAAMELLAPLAELAQAVRLGSDYPGNNSSSSSKANTSQQQGRKLLPSFVSGPYAESLYAAPNQNLGNDAAQMPSSVDERAERMQRYATWVAEQLMRPRDARNMRVVLLESPRRRGGFGLFNRAMIESADDKFIADTLKREFDPQDGNVDESAATSNRGDGRDDDDVEVDTSNSSLVIPAGEPLMHLPLYAVINYHGLCHGAVGASGLTPPKLCALLSSALLSDSASISSSSSSLFPGGPSRGFDRKDPTAARELQLLSLSLILAHLQFAAPDIMEGHTLLLRPYIDALLPQPPIPLCSFGKEELALFPLAEQILRIRKQLAAHHGYLAKNHIHFNASHFGALPLHVLSPARFMQSYCHAWQRHFSLRVSQTEQFAALVPMLEIMNQRRGKKAPRLRMRVQKASAVDERRRGSSRNTDEDEADDDDDDPQLQQQAAAGDDADTMLLEVSFDRPSGGKRSPELLHAVYDEDEDPTTQYIRDGVIDLDDRYACVVVPLPLPTPAAASQQKMSNTKNDEAEQQSSVQLPAWTPCITELFVSFRAAGDVYSDPRRRVAHEACIRPSKVHAILSKIAGGGVANNNCTASSFLAATSTDSNKKNAESNATTEQKAAARNFLLPLVQRHQIVLEEKLMAIRALAKSDKKSASSSRVSAQQLAEIELFTAKQRHVALKVIQKIGEWN